MLRVFLVVMAALSSIAPALADGAPLPLDELAKPGRVLMLRHANAPGIGDPPNFVVGDCATQRNLDAAGRAQARRLGVQMRAAGVAKARVLSSQWCRALDTARLLDVGPVVPLPALNSFLVRPDSRPRLLEGLRTFIAGLPVDGGPVIMVTHQVVINAFTDAAPPSGGGSIFRLNGTGTPKWLGVIPSEP